MGDHAAAPRPYLEALARAWQFLYLGFILDALVSIGGGMTGLLATVDVTQPGFWTQVWALAAKSFVTSLAVFLFRLKSNKADAAA